MRKDGVKQKALRLLEKIAEIEAGNEIPGWPPPCVGFIYQPKRPDKKK